MVPGEAVLITVVVSLGLWTVRVRSTTPWLGHQIGVDRCVVSGTGHLQRAAGDGVTGRRQIIKDRQ